jgi:uncharacterized membrane protein
MKVSKNSLAVVLELLFLFAVIPVVYYTGSFFNARIAGMTIDEPGYDLLIIISFNIVFFVAVVFIVLFSFSEFKDWVEKRVHH